MSNRQPHPLTSIARRAGGYRSTARARARGIAGSVRHPEALPVYAGAYERWGEDREWSVDGVAEARCYRTPDGEWRAWDWPVTRYGPELWGPDVTWTYWHH